MNSLKIAVVVPEFPAVTQTFTYTRIGTLAEQGVNINLFYSREGNFSLLETKLIKKMLNAGVKYSNLPSKPIGIIEFITIIFRNNFIQNILSSINFLKRSIKKSSLRNSLSSLLRFAPLLFWQPEVIHIETSYMVHGMLKSLESINVPIVISLRGADVDEKPLLSKKWINFFDSSKDHPLVFFHCVSGHIRNKAIVLGIPPDNSKTIYHGISDIEKKNIQPLTSVGDEIEKIISVARLSPEKGIDCAINTLKILHRSNYLLRLEIIGDGPEKEHLRELVKKLNLENYVIFWGSRENDWVREFLYKNANKSIYLQPSKREAFGMSILEAMFFGLPIVASKIGGIPEQINDGINGLLCETENTFSMAEKIIQLLNDDKLRHNLQNNAYRISRQEFSDSIEAANFITYLYQLADTHRKQKIK